MTSDDPRWCRIPALRELHDQWWTARAGRIGTSTRPFSRDWDQLLEDAGLVSADQRADAERDLRHLAETGLLELRSPRYRPHLIERVRIPVHAEPRLAALFQDPVDGKADPSLPDPASFPWEPELAFLRDTRGAFALADFLAIHRFLAGGGRDRPPVPVKERSLHLFGDEKRLDALLATAPFRSGRLTPQHLRCFTVPEPLGWRRGRNPDGPVIVLENASTWHSYVRWDEHSPRFSAVVYGRGLAFIDAIPGMADLFHELGAPRLITYFGDLDPTGLEIPVRASRRAQEAGLPPVCPHAFSYGQLLQEGSGRETPWDGPDASPEAMAWLGPFAEPARHLFARGQRLAQEHLGWEVLARITSPHPEVPPDPSKPSIPHSPS